MTRDAIEVLGLALIVTFCYLVWWPSAILVAGIILVIVGNVRDGKP